LLAVVNVRRVLEPDAIPSIDDPTDRVLVVESDPPRAYPVRTLNFHEIVNDTVDGDPLAVTWCPLCGSAVVYRQSRPSASGSFGRRSLP
jgi:hypothetical protein